MKPFFCASCQRERRADQVGEIIKCNGSKRCIFCVVRRQPGNAAKQDGK